MPFLFAADSIHLCDQLLLRHLPFLLQAADCSKKGWCANRQAVLRFNEHVIGMLVRTDVLLCVSIKDSKWGLQAECHPSSACDLWHVV